MSEFVYLFRTSDEERREAMGTPERAQRSMQAWLAWIRELEANGHLKNPGQPLESAGRVVRGKKKVVTDGPYVEAKDLVLGFIVVVVQLAIGARTVGGDEGEQRVPREAEVHVVAGWGLAGKPDGALEAPLSQARLDVMAHILDAQPGPVERLQHVGRELLVGGKRRLLRRLLGSGLPRPGMLGHAQLALRPPLTSPVNGHASTRQATIPKRTGSETPDGPPPPAMKARAALVSEKSLPSSWIASGT